MWAKLKPGFKTSAADFARNARGNIAIMTALGIGTMVVAVGAAVDLSAVSSRNNDLQNFADAAVLAAAKARTDDEAKLREIVDAVVARHNSQGWPLNIVVSFENDEIEVDVEMLYDTMLMGVVGQHEVPIKVQSKSPRAVLTPIDLALVVDTTDSMQGANIAALRLAATALVDEMEDMEAPSRLSLVPFGQYVNVGTAQGAPGNRSWIDMLDNGQSYQHCWEPTIVEVEETCRVVGTITYNEIVDGRNMGVRTKPDEECEGGVTRKGPEECSMRTHEWNGCMASRAGANGAMARVNGERIPVALDEDCGSELMPLTRDYTALRTSIAALDTRGGTYLPSGLVWGWRTLDAQQPYTQAATTLGPRTRRAMVFMTDGVNTRSRGDGRSDPTGVKHELTQDDGAAGLALTETLCAAIAAENIELYVVAYRLPEEGRTGEVLQSCATTSGHYFEPESANELVADFREIASLLDYTRLSF